MARLRAMAFSDCLYRLIVADPHVEVA